MSQITNINIGFSLVIAPLLFICYAFFLNSNNKSKTSIFACGIFLASLSSLQFFHLLYINQQLNPLTTFEYKFLLFIIPAMFYFFSRLTLFTEYQLSLKSLIHFTPLLLLIAFDQLMVVPFAFIIGASYCFWLMKVIYGLKPHRNRFAIEFFFISVFSIFAVIVLIFGFSLSYVDNAYFYYFYSNGIALAYILVTGALIIYPDLLNELTEAVKLGYVSSTLNNIDVANTIKKLNLLMVDSKIYENENLSLTQLANELELNGHQLSELINTQFKVSFSRYLRQIRVEQAKALLKSEPDSSVLSISMETGFKSQSNFYAAFKEIAGVSPGEYRKALGTK
ncbi:MAG: helix-turn-helix domain-containing protein [Kangiellaceae bacterium]